MPPIETTAALPDLNLDKAKLAEAPAAASAAPGEEAKGTPDQMAAFLGLSPDTWKMIGQVGKMIGAARAAGGAMTHSPANAPNLGVNFSSPSLQQQPAMAQSPDFGSFQAPQFPFIGVPGGGR